MQGNGGGRDPFFGFGDPFAGFGGFNGFSGHRSLMPNFFGGRDPFDDPFFTRPFGGMFESGHFGHPGNPFTDAHASGFLEHQVPQPGYPGNPFTDAHASGFLEHQVPQPNRLRGPIIEELNSDDEKEGQQEKKYNPRKHSRSSKEPYVEVPDDEAEGRKSKQIQYRNDFSRPSNMYSQPQNHSFSFQSSSVTYGGENGAYYTSSRTRRTGSDGLTIEESKAADTASRQASHQVFRGIHDKGHTVARKLNSDGRVDKRQTLHNLNEEELSGFEEVWKGSARKHLPGWSEGFNLQDGISGQNGQASGGGWALPSTEQPQHSENVPSDIGEREGASRPQHSGRMKAGVGDRSGSFRGRPRSGSAAANVDRVRKH
ncbi:hypothetical protein RHGRI_020106 [Rhododendron griersonianum]|uniref:Glycine-rich protein n=1 Tax=Rhododendron griersonianum TaxID=479676 RepID=A0AAV6JJ27_9ERIC|nr:hypothetical protein RHGRI_020106 [Rhododendron griersonianum]